MYLSEIRVASRRELSRSGRLGRQLAVDTRIWQIRTVVLVGFSGPIELSLRIAELQYRASISSGGEKRLCGGRAVLLSARKLDSCEP